MPIQVVDAVLLIIVAVGFYQGFTSGLVRLVLSFVFWVLALALGMGFAPHVASLLFATDANSNSKLFAGFLLIVVTVVLIGFGFSRIIESLLKVIRLGLLNRSLGGLFGAARNGFIVLLVLALFMPLLQHFAVVKNSVILSTAKPHMPVLIETASSWLGWANQKYTDLKPQG